MDDRNWRNLSIVLGVVCVLLLIAAGVLIATSSPSTPAPKPTVVVKSNTPLITATASNTTQAPTPSGSSSTSSGGPKVTPTPKPTQTSPTASITFSNLMLDALGDPAHTFRTFTFTSDGPGPINVQVLSSTGGSTKACLSVDLGKPFCTTGVTPRFSAALADTQHSLWTVTLIGTSASTPTIAIVFTWPSASPSITLAHGRFQGAPYPNSQKGFVATFQPRGAGQLTVASTWPGVTASSQLTLADVTGSTAVIIDNKAYSDAEAITPAYSAPVVASVKYQVLVLNMSTDAGRPDMSATISFP